MSWYNNKNKTFKWVKYLRYLRCVDWILKKISVCIIRNHSLFSDRDGREEKRTTTKNIESFSKGMQRIYIRTKSQCSNFNIRQRQNFKVKHLREEKIEILRLELRNYSKLLFVSAWCKEWRQKNHEAMKPYNVVSKYLRAGGVIWRNREIYNCH